MNNIYKSFDNMKRLENVCSNFDHVIDYDVVENLKQNESVYSDYPCYNCHCNVWYDKEKQKFGCRISRYGGVTEQIYEDTVEDVMIYVCSIYGND